MSSTHFRCFLLKIATKNPEWTLFSWSAGKGSFKRNLCRDNLSAKYLSDTIFFIFPYLFHLLHVFKNYIHRNIRVLNLFPTTRSPLFAASPSFQWQGSETDLHASRRPFEVRCIPNMINTVVQCRGLGCQSRLLTRIHYSTTGHIANWRDCVTMQKSDPTV